MSLNPYKVPITFTDETLAMVDELAADRAEPGKRADRSATVRELVRAETKRRASKAAQKKYRENSGVVS
jgi:hypothetical protein